MPHKPDVPCARCGTLMWRGRGSRPPGEAICRECRRKAPAPYGPRATRACDESPDKPCPVCGAGFRPRRCGTGEYTRTCSRACGDIYRRAKRFAAPCDDCGEPTTRQRTQAGRVCDGCSVFRKRARYARKTYARRAVVRVTDITPQFERHLRLTTEACPLCSIPLTREPYLPHSAELDHIVPIAAGGTHTMGNVRIVCRACNQSRPHDGSDLPGYPIRKEVSSGA
jgi:hypothetical protein